MLRCRGGSRVGLGNLPRSKNLEFPNGNNQKSLHKVREPDKVFVEAPISRGLQRSEININLCIFQAILLNLLKSKGGVR